MSNHPNHLPDVAIVAGGGVTWWAWLAENHDAITAFCAMVGAIGVLVGLTVKYAPPVYRALLAAYRWIRA